MARARSKRKTTPVLNLDKFNPTPKATPEPPKPLDKSSAKKKTAVVDLKEDKTYLYFPHGYKIRLKPDSGYRIFLGIMAAVGKFEEAVSLLERADFDASNENHAKQLLKLLMVRREAAIQMMKDHARWPEHAKTKLTHLKARAAAGNKRAQATLENPKRVKDGKWIGDIQEIISVCCGAYNCDPEKNRNIKKFDEGGLTFRKFPLKPTRNEPVYLMMFPSKHVVSVVSALMTAYKEKAQDEDVPKKWRKLFPTEISAG